MREVYPNTQPQYHLVKAPTPLALPTSLAHLLATNDKRLLVNFEGFVKEVH